MQNDGHESHFPLDKGHTPLLPVSKPSCFRHMHNLLIALCLHDCQTPHAIPEFTYAPGCASPAPAPQCLREDLTLHVEGKSYLGKGISTLFCILILITILYIFFLFYFLPTFLQHPFYQDFSNFIFHFTDLEAQGKL
jgi:hypothetical protein